MDVAAWLRGLGLGQYEKAFLANDVDSKILVDLTGEDLLELGVTSIGHRRKLLAAANLLRARTTALPVQAAAVISVSPVMSHLPNPERRQVAILFADLSGFTRLAGELDAEEVHELLGKFFEVADTSIADHGGTVDKHIGDCVMAVFGAPATYGNDAERSLRGPLAQSVNADRELSRVAYYRACLLFAAGKINACLAEHQRAFACATRAGDAEWHGGEGRQSTDRNDRAEHPG